MEAVTPGGIQPRAAALELPTSGVDGMDVWAVRATAAEVVGRVRAGGGPELVEAVTYRFVGHSRSDPGKYRPEGELDRWKERDPLRVAATRLTDDYGVSAEDVAAIDREVDERLAAIEESALAAPFPEPSEGSEFATARG